MRKILRCGKAGAAALTAVALGLAAGFALGMNSGAGAAAAAPRVAAGGIAAGYTAVSTSYTPTSAAEIDDVIASATITPGASNPCPACGPGTTRRAPLSTPSVSWPTTI